jgi:hypothetical protein
VTPSIDIRLASMVRAMTNVIGPAIEPGNSLAQEQARLMVGQLNMIATQWRRVFPYANLCLDDLCQTVKQLQPAGGPATMAAAAALTRVLETRNTVDPEKQYQEASRALEALVRAVATDGDEKFGRAFEQTALQFGLRQSGRDLAWFAMSGFDIDADSRPSIDEMLNPGNSPAGRIK